MVSLEPRLEFIRRDLLEGWRPGREKNWMVAWKMGGICVFRLSTVVSHPSIPAVLPLREKHQRSRTPKEPPVPSSSITPALLVQVLF